MKITADTAAGRFALPGARDLTDRQMTWQVDVWLQNWVLAGSAPLPRLDGPCDELAAVLADWHSSERDDIRHKLSDQSCHTVRHAEKLQVFCGVPKLFVDRCEGLLVLQGQADILVQELRQRLVTALRLVNGFCRRVQHPVSHALRSYTPQLLIGFSSG